jgi:hypothetical protein
MLLGKYRLSADHSEMFSFWQDIPLLQTAQRHIEGGSEARKRLVELV